MTPLENGNMAILRDANRYRYLRRHVYTMQNNGYPEFGIVGIRPYMAARMYSMNSILSSTLRCRKKAMTPLEKHMLWLDARASLPRGG